LLLTPAAQWLQQHKHGMHTEPSVCWMRVRAATGCRACVPRWSGSAAPPFGHAVVARILRCRYADTQTRHKGARGDDDARPRVCATPGPLRKVRITPRVAMLVELRRRNGPIAGTAVGALATLASRRHTGPGHVRVHCRDCSDSVAQIGQRASDAGLQVHVGPGLLAGGHYEPECLNASAADRRQWLRVTVRSRLDSDESKSDLPVRSRMPVRARSIQVGDRTQHPTPSTTSAAMMLMAWPPPSLPNHYPASRRSTA
jgi:hypothetical protein